MIFKLIYLLDNTQSLVCHFEKSLRFDYSMYGIDPEQSTHKPLTGYTQLCKVYGTIIQCMELIQNNLPIHLQQVIQTAL